MDASVSISGTTGTARLDSGTTTVVFHWTDGVPVIVHLGAKLPEDVDLGILVSALVRPTPQASLDETAPISLLPEFSRGFMGHPGLIAHRAEDAPSAWAGRFTFTRYATTNTGISFYCRDPYRGLDLCVTCSLDPQTNVLTFQNELVNSSDRSLLVDWFAAPVVPVPSRLTEYLSFHGRWCAEFALERMTVPVGLTKKENRRGRTSHEGFPGIVLLGENTSEDSGPCLAAHLGWSGNHRMVLERLPSGEMQLQMGALHFAGELLLRPGDRLKTPELYVTASSDGLSAMSQAFHEEIRRKILKFPDPQKPRPVTVNTWEALYFDHSWDKMTQLVDSAVDVGAERFVLDDGWFKNRDSDRAGLGDWFADEEKYPDGLDPLIDYVTKNGLEFGLWVEPEMVNPDSDLYRTHPDWVLGLADYPNPLSRNQLVLDLTNDDVTQYLYDCLEKLLTDHAIGYLKWDMNRDLVMPGNREGRAAAHKQTLALYALLDRIRAAFPHVEIESCASGGGRIDMEILKRTHRFWTSDSNDPVERARIQSGFSFFFPPEVMGAHIGPAWSHTSGRGFLPGFRGLVAGVGHLGLELDLGGTTERELPDMRHAVERYKADRHIWHGGNFYRLPSIDPALIGFASLSKDKHQARACVVQIDRPRSTVPALVRIPGLDPDVQYHVAMDDPDDLLDRANRGFNNQLASGHLVVSGAVLTQVGLQLPVLYAQTGLYLTINKSETS